MEILAVKELTQEEAQRVRPRVHAMREFHHTIAKLIARGYKDTEVARVVNRSPPTIRNFRLVPANAALIASYVGSTEEVMTSELEYRLDIRKRIGTKALEQLDELLEARAIDSPRTLLAIAADTDDRTGIAKTTVTANLNVNVGARLDRAKARAMKVVEGRVIEDSSSS